MKSVRSLAVAATCLGLSSCAGTATAVKSDAPQARTPIRAAAVKPGAPEFPGFRAVTKDGVDYFCQKSTATGSRVRVADKCYTREALQSIEKNNRDFFDEAGMQGAHETLHMDSPR